MCPQPLAETSYCLWSSGLPQPLFLTKEPQGWCPRGHRKGYLHLVSKQRADYKTARGSGHCAFCPGVQHGHGTSRRPAPGGSPGPGAVGPGRGPETL